MMAEEEVPPAEAARLGRDVLNLLRRVGVMRLPRLPRHVPGFRLVSPIDLMLVAASSSFCGTGVIMVLNAEAQEVQGHHYSIKLALGFIVFLVAYRESQRFLIRRTARAIEAALHEQRVRVGEKVLKLDLGDVEALSRSAIVDGLAHQHEALSQTVVPLLIGFQSLVLLSFMLAYLFWQSMLAGALTLVFAGFIAQGYLGRATELQGSMSAAAAADVALRRTTEEIARGFKELRLNGDKMTAIRDDLVSSSHSVADHRASVARIIGDLVTTGNSASYMLGAAVVFVLPVLSGQNGSDLSRIVTTVLFLLGPLSGLVSAAQSLSAARFALAGIDLFETRLNDRLTPLALPASAPVAFERLKLEGVGYAHRGEREEHGFAIKDVTLDLAAGETVFVTGGNGSGKTTLLRLLTGLYPVQAGRILLNGVAVTPDRIEDYRHLFATVFADFHTFHKPYGLDAAGIERLRANLEALDIGRKLPEDLAGGYNPEALSTGQRKRLALALALAEQRPVMVLDEWAADQDPAYRDRFYRELIPELKASGKAVLVVTHDDRYFALADRRYHMQDGRLRDVPLATGTMMGETEAGA